MAKSVTELWEIASYSREVRTRVAKELLTSWPIPDREGSKVGYWFFYYASFGPPPAEADDLYPPCWKAYVSADGVVSRLQEIRPADVGLDAPQGQPFAQHAWRADWSLEEVEGKRVALLDSYERAVPLWLAARGNPPPARAGVVSEFRDRFLELTEPPLLPCYRALGKDYFTWVQV